MKTLYVGCALRGAPAEFVAGVTELKKMLDPHFTVLHFIGLSPTATAAEIYTTDITCAAEADLMLAVADVPSTGLGLELGKRAALGKPTVIAYRENVDLSRMVLGLASLHENFSVLIYRDYDDLLRQMQAYA